MFLHNKLTFTTVWANSADDKLIVFFSSFSQKMGFDISCSISTADNLHEMSKPVSLEKSEKYFIMLSAENFTQNAKH